MQDLSVRIGADYSYQVATEHEGVMEGFANNTRELVGFIINKYTVSV